MNRDSSGKGYQRYKKPSGYIAVAHEPCHDSELKCRCKAMFPPAD